MTETTDKTQLDDVLPSQVRCEVSKHNRFQLPASLVAELGFQSARTDTADGALVAWYYHEKHDKAVLGSDAVDQPALELVGARRLGGVSNDAIAAGDVDGARVTITSNLPDSVYEQLTRGKVVLKPVYAGGSAELDVTCVSVYPASEYDHGLLPNVDRKLRKVEDDDGTEHVESVHKHANSI